MSYLASCLGGHLLRPPSSPPIFLEHSPTSSPFPPAGAALSLSAWPVLGLVIHTLWAKILLQNFLFIPKVERDGTLPLWESVRTWSGSWPYPQYTEEESLPIEGMRQRTRNKGKRDRILVESDPGSCGTSCTPPMLDLGKEIHLSA